VTTIFAVYAFSLLAALLTVGSLSDYVGRRPVILAALVLNAAAMMLFIRADSAAALIEARLL
jgi:MFS family permease